MSSAAMPAGAGGRTGNAQGTLLVLLSLVSVAATALLAPIIPSMVAEFAAADPAAEQKGVLALAIPALIVAICSPFMGKIIDSFGRKRLLIVALVAYAIIGRAQQRTLGKAEPFSRSYGQPATCGLRVAAGCTRGPQPTRPRR